MPKMEQKEIWLVFQKRKFEFKLNMFSIAIECYSNSEPLLKHLNLNVKYRSESKQLEMGFNKFTKSEFWQDHSFDE